MESEYTQQPDPVPEMQRAALDPDTIRAAQAGDDSALETVWRAAEPVIRRRLTAFGGGDTLDDLAQEAAIKIIRGIGTFDPDDPDTNFEAWTTTVARNTGIDAYRKRVGESKADKQRGTSREVAIDTQDHGFLYDQQADWRSPGSVGIGRPDEQVDACGAIANVLSRLSPERREILACIAIDGMTYEEYSLKSGLKMGTVRSRLNRAKTDMINLATGGILGPEYKKAADDHAAAEHHTPAA